MNKEDLDLIYGAIEVGLSDAREEISQAAWNAIAARLEALVTPEPNQGATQMARGEQQ
jgi:hypothetical protein